jgi:hypothetical protein
LARIEEEARVRADEVRAKIAKEQAEMKTIDDEIQDKGMREIFSCHRKMSFLRFLRSASFC